MKNKLLVMAFAVMFTACVQKKHKKVIVATLKVDNKTNLKTVGIIGGSDPLDWDNGLPMQEIIKDSLYSASFIVETGYKFMELKFTIDGEPELKDGPNRRIDFSDADSIFLKAVFNEQ